jgi:hypothetical protein
LLTLWRSSRGRPLNAPAASSIRVSGGNKA